MYKRSSFKVYTYISLYCLHIVKLLKPKIPISNNESGILHNSTVLCNLNLQTS